MNMRLPSPCVGVCQLDEAEAYCLGCLRTPEEIAVWPTANFDLQKAILMELRARRQQRGQVGQSDRRYQGRRRNSSTIQTS